MPEPRVYAPADRPDVEVLIDDQWHEGELRMWTWREDAWWAQVQWRKKPGSTHIDTVPADHVRPAPEVSDRDT